jgi:hypothetical protein
LHGIAWFSFELCVGMGMAASIDGVCLMKMARQQTGNRIGTALRDLEKLLEEATDV